MPKKTTLLVALTLAAALMAAPPPAQAAAAKKAKAPAAQTSEPAKASRAVLDLKENAFDFGPIMEDQVLEHAFEVRNTGPDTLVIDSVKPG
jgi:nucleoid-associated protein YgaU